MQEVILVKLGEIVLKGLNRRTFEDRLLKNIRRRIARAGNFEVYSMQSTIYIEPKDEDADIDEAEERISKIFGVIGYARACVCEKDMDAITKMAPEYLNDTLAGFKTFKVDRSVRTRSSRSAPWKSPARWARRCCARTRTFP